MFYSLIRPLLFCLPPELAHHIALGGLKLAAKCHLISAQIPSKPLRRMGLDFINPVGIAAGLDKNGEYIDALACLGPGFIEIGTITPKAQEGNAKPRLFRLVKQQALINRMGFNNKGVDYLVEQVKKSRYQGVLGINIGKNLTTPVENALDDYLICMNKVYEYADYIVVNLSSPNTPGLRALQHGEHLRNLLGNLKAQQHRLRAEYDKHVPLVVKVAPDLSSDDISDIAQVLHEYGIEGLTVSNTTIGREGVQASPHAEQQGGLSGAPLLELANNTLEQFKQILGDSITFIGVGGITDKASAKSKFAAGADLIQVYSGMIYQGPNLLKSLLD